MKTFAVRVVNLVVITGLILGYNTVLTGRAQNEQIAMLNAELETAKLFQQTMIRAEAAELESPAYKDGIYSGQAEGFGGTVAVDVTVSQGKITDISIISAENEDGAYLTMAEDIIPSIIDRQSAEVDMISGATYSSAGIKNAVEQALEKAAK
ncbi:MAG: FMN-binding protein [Coprococcus sp.]